MIVTLTPNPSLDKTYHIGTLERGSVMRIGSMNVEAAGKGVNVARALHANGGRVLAVVPVGGLDGGRFQTLLGQTGVPFQSVPIQGNVRSNISVVEADGTVTKLNEAGPELSAAEIKALVAAAVGACSPGDWLVASGSLAPGMPDAFYADLCVAGRAAGVSVAVDASGGALVAAVESRPSLIKPNADELRQLTGLSLERVGDIASAAQRIVADGVDQVLVSLGSYGAILVTESAVVHGRVSVDSVRNNVGAGDTLLAGFLAGGDDPQEALCTALAWARAAVRSPSTTMAHPEEADRRAVQISDRVPGDLVVQGD